MVILFKRTTVMKKKTVAVIYGGWSPEAEISRKSGRAVAEALRRLGFNVVELELTRDIAKELLKINPDLVFPVLHGKPGEDGTLQGLLELMGIPYVGEGVKTSAVCMDKELTKMVLHSSDVPTPAWCSVKGNTIRGKFPNSYPLVIKPAEGGSSLGLKILKNASELEKELKKFLLKEEKYLIEEFVKGREFTLGYVKGELLPPLEIKPRRGLYDYKSKYTKGETDFEEVNDPSLLKLLHETAEKVVQVLEIRVLCRIDIKVSEEGIPYVLEVNTMPGMTETSLLPKMADMTGYKFDDLIAKLVNDY